MFIPIFLIFKTGGKNQLAHWTSGRRLRMSWVYSCSCSCSSCRLTSSSSRSDCSHESLSTSCQVDSRCNWLKILWSETWAKSDGLDPAEDIWTNLTCLGGYHRCKDVKPSKLFQFYSRGVKEWWITLSWNWLLPNYLLQTEPIHLRFGGIFSHIPGIPNILEFFSPIKSFAKYY